MQAERTRLAWARSSLALAVLGGLELRIGHVEPSVWQRFPGILTLILAIACWVYGGTRYRSIVRDLAAGRSVLNHRSRSVLAVVAVIPAGLAIWALAM